MESAATSGPLPPGKSTLRTEVAGSAAARLQLILDRLVPATDPDAIILFGSRARGDDHSDSDFDLLVLVPETRPFGKTQPSWLWHLVKDLGLSIDVLMRQTAVFERRSKETNTLESAVSQDGIIVYERSKRS